MNAIMGCALLISQSKLDPVQRRTLGVLEDAGKQMLAVLNDLLDCRLERRQSSDRSGACIDVAADATQP